MPYKRNILMLCFCALVLFSSIQFAFAFRPATSARSLAMGGSTCAMSGNIGVGEIIGQNPATLHLYKKGVSLNYNNGYGIRDFVQKGLSVSWKSKDKLGINATFWEDSVTLIEEVRGIEHSNFWGIKQIGLGISYRIGKELNFGIGLWGSKENLEIG